MIERSEGVATKAIKTSYSATAGTAYVTFDNVKVPVENTLGPVDAGLIVMLSNFNHERSVHGTKMLPLDPRHDLFAEIDEFQMTGG